MQTLVSHVLDLLADDISVCVCVCVCVRACVCVCIFTGIFLLAKVSLDKNLSAIIFVMRLALGIFQ